jgi:hypothetical protein
LLNLAIEPKFSPLSNLPHRFVHLQQDKMEGSNRMIEPTGMLWDAEKTSCNTKIFIP